jgi:hypothetical protein
MDRIRGVRGHRGWASLAFHEGKKSWRKEPDLPVVLAEMMNGEARDDCVSELCCSKTQSS